MSRQVIETPNAPTSGFYSQGVKAGPNIWISGTTGIDPATGSMAGDSIKPQTLQALKNCLAVLEAGGGQLSDITEVGILLADPADFTQMNEVYGTWFQSFPPTRYVAKLGVELPGVLISIRMTAYLG